MLCVNVVARRQLQTDSPKHCFRHNEDDAGCACCCAALGSPVFSCRTNRVTRARVVVAGCVAECVSRSVFLSQSRRDSPRSVTPRWNRAVVLPRVMSALSCVSRSKAAMCPACCCVRTRFVWIDRVCVESCCASQCSRLCSTPFPQHEFHAVIAPDLVCVSVRP